MPNKKEIKVLKYLWKVKSRFDNNKRGDTEANIKANLGITDEDIGDMHYSKFLQFSSFNDEPIICITHEGSTLVENYRYEKIKDFSYLIFGIAAIAAAVFSALAVFK